LIYNYADISDAALTISGVNISAVEGQMFSGTVANFTDANAASEASDFTAVIDWGDEVFSTGTIVSNGGGMFSVTGAHTYVTAVAQITYRPQVEVIDRAGNSAKSTASTQLTDPTFTVIGQDAQLGDYPYGGIGVIGTFTDPNPDAAPEDFTVRFDDQNGFGPMDAFISGGANGGFQVSAYWDLNSYWDWRSITFPFTRQFTVFDRGGASASAVSTISGWSRGQQQYTSLVGSGVRISVPAGVQLSDTLIATFQGPPPGQGTPALNSEIASIDWGDLYSPGYFPFRQWSYYGYVDYSNSAYHVYGTHAYLLPGTYLVTVRLAEEQGPVSSVVHVTIPGIPSQPASVTVNPIAATTGTTLQNIVVADYDDINAAYSENFLQASIAWGDGSTSTGSFVTVSSGHFEIHGSHKYLNPGTFPVHVTVITGLTGEYQYSTEFGDFNFATVDGPAIPPPPPPPPPPDFQVQSSTGTQVGAMVDFDTGDVVLGSFSATGDVLDNLPSVWMDWGDNRGPVRGSVVKNADDTYSVHGSYEYTTSGSYSIDIVLAPSWFPPTVDDYPRIHSTAIVVAGSLAGQARSEDPDQSAIANLGHATVHLDAGGAIVSQSLDFDQSPGTSVGGDPALVYNSNAVNVRPIIEADVTPDPSLGVPTQIQAELIWNGANPQPWVSFTTSGHQAGDTYAIAVQSASAVLADGQYPWTVHVRTTFADGVVVDGVTSGTSNVVIRDGSGDLIDPYGAGWSIEGIDRLELTEYGLFFDEGRGNSRFFQASQVGVFVGQTPSPQFWTDYLWGGNYIGADDRANPALSFVSPPEDLGSLVENPDRSFTYTAQDGTKKHFNPQGLEDELLSLDGQETQYQYDTNDRLAQVTSSDGGITTLNYNANYLSSIVEPGGRTLNFTFDSNGNLKTIQNVDRSPRTFSYDSKHHLTRDQYGPLDTHYTYDPNNGSLTEIDEGLGTTYQIAAANVQALNTAAVVSPNQIEATVTDALSHETQYLLDNQGRILQQMNPAGDSEEWTYNERGQVTSHTDGLAQTTTYIYDQSSVGYDANWNPVYQDDLLEVDNPDGSFTRYVHDPVNHQVIRETNALGEVTQTFVDPKTGDVAATVDADGEVTSNAWTNGLLMSTTESHAVTDKTDHTTTFTYDNNRRETSSTDAMGIGTQTTYDSKGNVATETDGDHLMTTTVYDALNRLTSQTDPAPDSKTAAPVTTYEYDAIGDETKIVDPRGIVTTKLYDQRGLLTSETLAFGTPDAATTLYQYDVAENLVSTTDPDLNQTTFTYDRDNRQITQTVGANSSAPSETTTTVYNNGSQVTDTIDQLGNDTHETYNAVGAVLTTTEAYGTSLARTNTNQYDNAGELVAQIDAMNNESVTTFDNAGIAISTTDAAFSTPETTTTQLDASGNVASITDPRGETTTYTYNDDDQVVLETEAANSTTPANRLTKQFRYDGDGLLTSSCDPRGIWTINAYNGDGQLASTTVDGTAQTLYQHDGDGNVVKVTDPDGNVTLNTYDNQNRLTVTTTGGSTTQSVYDANGNVVDSINALDGDTHNVFNALGNMISSTVDFGGAHPETTLFQYDGDNNLTMRTSPPPDPSTAPIVTTFAYDALNRQITETFASTSTIPLISRTAYNPDDQVTDTIDPAGVDTHKTYSALAQLLTTTAAYGTQPEQTTYTYNDDGALLTSTDAAGVLTQYTVDDLNRLIGTLGTVNDLTTESLDADGNVLSTSEPLQEITSATYNNLGQQVISTDSSNQPTYTTYDDNGNVLTVQDPNHNITTFTYDDLGNKKSMTDTFQHTTSYDYNAAGQLTSQIDRDGRTTTINYNDEGQVVSETKTGGGATDNLAFGYDGDGNLLTASNNAGTYTYTYNGYGELATQSDPNGIKLSYEYDSDGDVISLVDTLGGTVTSTYNSDGMLSHRTLTTGAGSIGVNFGYNSDNEPISLSRLAGTTIVANTIYGYDGEGRLRTLQHSGAGSGSIESFAYSLDQDSRLYNLTDTTASGTTNTPYLYDATNQLTTDGSIFHSYDNNGNRTDPGYSPGAGNQLLTDGTWNYHYDYEGNRISKVSIANGDAWTYTYDNDNHLTTAVHKDSSGNLLETVDYRYDVFGNLLEEDTLIPGFATSVSRHAYDSNGQLLADLDGSGNLVTRYLNGDAVDEVLAREAANGSVAWYLIDREGSVRDLVNNSGAVINSQGYTAFGVMTFQTNASAADRFGYAGAQYDIGAGAYILGERYYDPTTGVWTTQDPSGLSADVNNYRYVGNNPTDYTDVTGLFGDKPMTMKATRGANGGQASTEPTRTAEMQGLLDLNQRASKTQRSPARQALLEQIAKEERQPGGYWGGLVNPLNWVRAYTTGDPNAPDSVFADANDGWVAGRDKGAILVADQYERLVGVQDQDVAEAAADLRATGGPVIAAADVSANISANAAKKAALLKVSKTLCQGNSAGGAFQALSQTAKTAMQVKTAYDALTRLPAQAEQINKAFENQDYLGAAKGLLSIASSVTGFLASLMPCFAAGTPLLTPDGPKSIEDFHPGNWILTAPENEPASEPLARRVEAVFRSESRILNLWVRTRLIRTTARHPFWVDGRGWTRAGELMAGDRLRSQDGHVAHVDQIQDAGEVEVVYNLRVSEHHTYFVGAEDWGFSVWAHNDCEGGELGDGEGATPKDVPVTMSLKEAQEMGLTERDPLWPIHGLHETEEHHPLMQGPTFRPFWTVRGFSNDEVDDFVKVINKDVHRAISESSWWDQELLGNIGRAEAGLGRLLTKDEVLREVNKLLNRVQEFSPKP
jgi:RHS repeat-associated protein